MGSAPVGGESTSESSTSSASTADSSPALSGPSASELAGDSLYKGMFESKPNNGVRPRSEAAQHAELAALEDKATQQQITQAKDAPPAATSDAVTTTPADPTPGSPEARIAELEKTLGRYKSFESVIKSLEQSGYDSGEAALQALAKNQQEQQQATLQEQRNTALTNNLSQVFEGLKAKYQGLFEKGVYTLDEANAALMEDYKQQGQLAQRALEADWVVEDMKRERESLHAQQESTKTTDEMSRAVAEFPVLAIGRNPEQGKPVGYGESIVRGLHALTNGDVPVSALAAYVTEFTDIIQQQAVADYVAKQAQTTAPSAPPVPVNGAGGAPPATNPNGKADESPNMFGTIDWARHLGIKIGN